MINQDERGNLFGKWQVGENTWCITNRWANFMYLLIGEEKALLIDTGTGEGNIRKFVETITDKPVMVVNTHGHFDHTGGNFWWPEAWMKKESVKCAREAFASRGQEWFADKDYPEYEIHTLEDGEVIDLGNREVEVIAIGAHNEGSIAFLDRKMRAIFVGDELESGQVLLFVRNKNIPIADVAALHKANMEKIKALRSEYDLIWPAHNGAPLVPDPYLEDFIALDEELIAGTAQIAENTGGLGFPTDCSQGFFAEFGVLERAVHGLASIVYIKS